MSVYMVSRKQADSHLFFEHYRMHAMASIDARMGRRLGDLGIRHTFTGPSLIRTVSHSTAESLVIRPPIVVVLARVLASYVDGSRGIFIPEPQALR